MRTNVCVSVDVCAHWSQNNHMATLRGLTSSDPEAALQLDTVDVAGNALEDVEGLDVVRLRCPPPLQCCSALERRLG